MTIGIGIFITAVGAILTYAVEASVDGFDINAAGVIVMLAGIVITVVAAAVTLGQRRRVVAPLAPTTTTVVQQPTAVRRVDPQVIAETPMVVERPVIRE